MILRITIIFIICFNFVFIGCSKKTEVKGKVILKSGQVAPNAQILINKIPNNCLKCSQIWVITNTDNNGDYYFTYSDDPNHFYFVYCKTDSSNNVTSYESLTPGKINIRDFTLTK